MAPCIEVVGYRQRKKGISSFGDLCSDFGANVKFLIGKKKKFKKINIGNLKTNTLKEIWTGKDAEDLRLGFINNKPNKVCKLCQESYTH